MQVSSKSEFCNTGINFKKKLVEGKNCEIANNCGYR